MISLMCLQALHLALRRDCMCHTCCRRARAFNHASVIACTRPSAYEKASAHTTNMAFATLADRMCHACCPHARVGAQHTPRKVSETLKEPQWHLNGNSMARQWHLNGTYNGTCKFTHGRHLRPLEGSFLFTPPKPAGAFYA